jgi:hypothetical protein
VLAELDWRKIEVFPPAAAGAQVTKIHTVIAGDYDGDGLSEALFVVPQGERVVNLRGAHRGESFSVPTHVSLELRGLKTNTHIGQAPVPDSGVLLLSGCEDIDGDSKPDLLFGKSGYFLHEPPGYRSLIFEGRIDGTNLDDATTGCLDINADGRPEHFLAVEWWPGGTPKSSAVARATDPLSQSLVYQEQLPRDLGGGCNAEADGTRYVVLGVANELWIYP